MSAWKDWVLPAWEIILSAWEGVLSFPLLSLGYTFHTPVVSGHAQRACHSPYKVLFFSYPSDLMKSTVVDES